MVIEQMDKIINRKDFERILQHCKSHHALAFKLAYYYKIRISEIAILERHDFDFNNMVIFIRKKNPKFNRIIPFSQNIVSRYSVESLLPIRCGCRALEISFNNKAKLIGLNLCFNDLRI
jgi:integrase